eukprot:TRINITY_DN12139_c0_g1_i1.p4 TRINITY_DN12139_c0_g1~~TRINITY_DN12139_c0_g1_i1.p4  ORF type:complete len:110 (+),score=37.85 TRINITY_DN12139_c0_g1_i1:643-972(+)
MRVHIDIDIITELVHIDITTERVDVDIDIITERVHIDIDIITELVHIDITTERVDVDIDIDIVVPIDNVENDVGQRDAESDDNIGGRVIDNAVDCVIGDGPHEHAVVGD